jgi:SAM-dependent methyltransferase
MTTEVLTSDVRQFYTGYVAKEWRRLARDPYHQLEFDTTMHFLQKYLPQRGHILDAGGGPGRYTMALAKQGYDLTLLDYTPANLEFARRRIARSGVKKQVRDVLEGSIVDLSRFPDNSFDALICTGGPLSHVIDAGERDKAVDELIRVAKPGAPVFVSVMSRLSLMVVELTMFPEEVEMPHFTEVRETGDYNGQYGFTACHFFLPEELRAAFDGKPVDVLAMAGLEGIGSNHRREVNRLAKNEARWRIWLETHYRFCEHPAVVATSEHMLLVGKKI